jgi:acyl transferase domain-containing protein/NAD(P)-dependent dehydrogenase (short-subunit alcohol dehydrogenase family)/acyl carrier protein
MTSDDAATFDVAVIGMSARFPGAPNVKQFWHNLVDGVESIRSFSVEELLECGVSPYKLRQSGFVRARPVLEGIDKFAAAFFGYSPREAELMDPQHRVFLECAWLAFEDAGYAPRHIPGRVAVYAACSLSTYLLFNLVNSQAIDADDEAFQVMIGTDKDFVATRVSYKLNLRGPSLSVQSGCSSSLVAIGMAVQSLLSLQCDMALAGGVAIQVPQRTGYCYQLGGIASPDGHCRPFSNMAQGTVFGDGVGAVVLRRLEDAIRDKDHIYACIRAVAMNNDGSCKVGYTAPSVAAQSEVIREAQSLAMISADNIGYVEAHGTATELGDAVEVAALTRAFRRTTNKVGYCALGSVKSNIGHLDAAAGVASFIKVALMLEHRWLVPTLHFNSPNPAIAFDGGPFNVNTESKKWLHDSGILRAGVSSFGIGGTNVHVILEEAPNVTIGPCARPLHIVTLSAETIPSLERAIQNIQDVLREPSSKIDHVAYTLNLGRESLEYRRAVVGETKASVAQSLQAADRHQTYLRKSVDKANLCFLFPGGGCQYPLMGRGLYATEPLYRDIIDRCREVLSTHLGRDLREFLFPAKVDASVRSALAAPSIGLPALFATEYALAELLMSWGLRPAVMIGHSLGEYVAACISGVFGFADALKLVAIRGKLFEQLPAGAMAAVDLPEGYVRDLNLQEVSIAAVNSAGTCVISGPQKAMARALEILGRRGIDYSALHIDVAAHSSMVDSIMGPFRDALSQIPMAEPEIPIVSNLTGGYISGADARSVEYWCRQLRETVRFADGLALLNADERCFQFLELGPGRALSGVIKLAMSDRRPVALAALPHAQEGTSDLFMTYSMMAELWEHGVEIDWRRFHWQTVNRISLPGYPFEIESTRHWISPVTRSAPGREERARSSRYYSPSWQRTPLVPAYKDKRSDAEWLILGGPSSMVAKLEDLLLRLGDSVSVQTTSNFRGHAISASASFDPCSVDDYRELFVRYATSHPRRFKILHLWNCVGSADRRSVMDHNINRAFAMDSLMSITKTLVELDLCADIVLVSRGAVQIGATEQVDVFESMLQAACVVIPQEVDKVTCKLIDIDDSALTGGQVAQTCEYILTECDFVAAEDVIAYRGSQRWRRCYNELLFPAAKGETIEQSAGVYVLLGGLGKIGSVLARALASPSNVIVVGSRMEIPQDADLERGCDSQANYRLALLKELTSNGCRTAAYNVDVADEISMQQFFETIEARFGEIRGVIHLAGITGEDALRLLPDLTAEECQRQLRPKSHGCVILDKLLFNRRLEFCMFFSSTASFLGGPGLLAYAAGNCFLDSFAESKKMSTTQWVSINWDGWILPNQHAVLGFGTALDDYAIPADEAMSALFTIIRHRIVGQVVVSTSDLNARILARNARARSDKRHIGLGSRGEMALITNYVAPRSRLEKDVAAIWAETLGVDRVGIHDNLFELGGNSLIGLRIIRKIAKALGAELKISALFEAPTVASIATLLSRGPDVRGESDGPRARGNNRRELRLSR